MDELADLVQGTADRLAQQNAGAVVAGISGGQVQVRGTGRAGPGGEAPGPQTEFGIGAVSKVFTSLLLARLVLDGTVCLDEPLAEVLDGEVAVPSRRGQPVTLRQLATHSSGLPRDFLHWRGSSCVLERLGRTRLRSVPGRGFRYSGLGAGLLGLALAHRAGTGYGEVLAREVCGPLGLTGTGVRDGGGRGSRLRPVVLPGAGGVHSTAADLVVLLQAQLAAEHTPDGPLAPAITLTRETRHRVNRFAWTHLGWLAHRLHHQQGGHLQIWHHGGAPGSRAFVAFDPATSVGVVALTTHRQPDTAATALLRRLQTHPA
ncbi:serine hydrolase domain-containing protein [Streptomyces sp. NRRL WC-3742]|uniref:serine hydrolase domain-containing protein n=1 Tax=Streptomyces sp. NRRL WC-3742 TaxID=1463934 RepID=UPI00069260BD|nr:serine hydrolase domain-containing protein [Streptomyces sp. NRRL WC-3742]